MNITRAQRISEKVNDQYLKDVYNIIAKAGQSQSIAGDSEPMLIMPQSACEEIIGLSAEAVKSRYLAHFGKFQTPEEARKEMFIKIAGDTLINQKNGIGLMNDPSVYTQSQIPVMLGPWEGSSVYAPGGLPATIIDKKARGMIMHGASFRSENKKLWTNDKVELLEAAAEVTGFNDKVSDASADAFIYGGSILYPVFNDDSPSRYRRDLNTSNLKKDCISRWVNTDRWNVVTVPSYIVTDRDYLRPRTIYIPQGAIEINTSRVAMIKPKPTPYWISLYNIGWAPSDMSGWLRAYYGYEITCQSIPVMAQQMSLILYKMPLDALNATIGPDKVKQLMQINEEKMAEWSAVDPKAVNMVGDVEVVDRTYSGFEQFIGAMKSNLAAQAELPEPVLWHTPNKGFSDNTTESLLKQSETLQMKQRFLERCLAPCTDALIAHVFGTDSEEWKHRREIRMTFSKPIISTEKDLAEVGARFAASVSSFVNAGVSPDTAIELSAQFFPTVKITDELLAKAKESYEKVMEHEEKMGAQKAQLGQPQGNVKGKATTTGSFTKSK